MASKHTITKEGREAFDQGENWLTVCKYPLGTREAVYFRDGWVQGRLLHNLREDLLKKESKEWEAISNDCPWRHVNSCKALSPNACDKDLCAPYHFIKNLKR